MKRLIPVLLAMLVFSGCDTTLKNIEKLNVAPTLNFLTAGEDHTVLKDSFKLWKDVKYDYPYAFTVSVHDPNENIRKVYYEKSKGLGDMYAGDEKLNGNEFEVTENEIRFGYLPSVHGEHELIISIEDAFEQSSSVRLQLTAFDNLRPACRFRMKKLGNYGRYEYQVDASESYDRDERFGGSITAWEFTINQKVVELKEAQRSVIFPGPGVYAIEVRVKDNNGMWSEFERMDFSVED